MIPTRKTNPQSGVTRIQLNRQFETQAEMEKYVKENYPSATIKQFWPTQVLVCVIEIPEEKTCEKK